MSSFDFGIREEGEVSARSDDGRDQGGGQSRNERGIECTAEGDARVRGKGSGMLLEKRQVTGVQVVKSAMVRTSGDNWEGAWKPLDLVSIQCVQSKTIIQTY